MPTSAPTKTTQLRTTPLYDVRATKPEEDTQSWFIINSNEDPLFGEIWCESPSNVSWDIKIGDQVFKNTPANYTVAENDLLTVEITLRTAGLVGGRTHAVNVTVWAKTANTLRVDDTLPIAFLVDTVATNYSRVVIVGDPPIMGEEWGSQVHIYPYDADDQQMYEDDTSNFAIELQIEGTGTNTIKCKTVSEGEGGPSFHFYAECDIDDLASVAGAAGDWKVVVELDGELISRDVDNAWQLNGTNSSGTLVVDMWCPKNYYEKEDAEGLMTCYECDTLNKGDMQGAICREKHGSLKSGTKLERVVLKEGFWRANSNAEVVYPCPLEDACSGGDTGKYCNEGYIGPLCSTCDYKWFLNDDSQCVSCRDTGNFVTPIVVVCILVVIVCFWGGLRYFHRMVSRGILHVSNERE
jgi:hypothetical protein